MGTYSEIVVGGDLLVEEDFAKDKGFSIVTLRRLVKSRASLLYPLGWAMEYESRRCSLPVFSTPKSLVAHFV